MTVENPPDSVVLLGAGGVVHILYWQIRAAWPNTEVAILDEYIDKQEIVFKDKAYPIIKDWDFTAARRARYGNGEQGFRHFILSVTEPKFKLSLVEKALARGMEPAPMLIDPSAVIVGEDVKIGRGGFIAAGAQLQAASEVEDYVTVGPQALVGHHCVVEKYASVSPRAVMLGFVRLGEAAHLGAGAVVRGYLSIAAGVTVGMQAAVTCDLLEDGATYVGVPAKKLSPREPQPPQESQN